MRVLRGCKMISLETYRGKSRVLLGFLLLASCVPPVRTIDYFSLNATNSISLGIWDRLLSPNQIFELGIFQYNVSGIATSPATPYYLSIRYAHPIELAVTWVASRNIPLTSAAVLQLQSTGSLELSDTANNIQKDKIFYTFTDNVDVVSAQLLDTGNLVLINKNRKCVWNSFENSPPTDTLLPGQGMHRNQGHVLNSWQRSGNPAIANDTYLFGWDAKGVLALSWTCPKPFLNWKGGSYIPAPDVYAAHTIHDVDYVYFHPTLGHLYIGSNPPTAILSGGPDLVSITTLKRITMYPDGGLRILQYTINQTVTSNQSWEVVANWVVSDRPDSRSQCTTFGTCGLYSECVSPIDSPSPVQCQCAGKDNATASAWFTPVDGNATNGRTPTTPGQVACVDGSNADPKNRGDMLVLNNTDMPWGGDYRNITGDASAQRPDARWKDCYCAGAVYSEQEKTRWLGTGVLFNLGYPTVALHGTDRTSYLRNQAVQDHPNPPVAEKEHKRVEVLVSAVVTPGVLLIAGVVFCLCRREQVQQRVRDCGLCFRRPRPDVFQGDAE